MNRRNYPQRQSLIWQLTNGMRGIVAPHASPPTCFATAFVLCSSVFVPIAASLMPPMQNADETAHFNRVDQLAHGGIIAVRFDNGTSSGGMVDRGAGEIAHVMEDIPFHPSRKVTHAMLRQANSVTWGKRGMTFFLNTAIYPPFLYLPATIGLWASILAHATIVHSLVIMRLANGFACIAVASTAVALAGGIAPFLFIVLSLPMSQSLFAAVSQDGMMLALAALAASLITRLATSNQRPNLSLSLLCLCLTGIIMARPPYLPLSIIPLVLPNVSRQARFACLALILTAVGIWIGVVAAFTIIDVSAHTSISPGAQARFLITHSDKWFSIARNTLGDATNGGWTYARGFIGILGWLDVLMPALFYKLIWLPLAGALALSSPTEQTAFLTRDRLLIGGAIAVSVLAVFLAEYLTWTPVGSLAVSGVQGRYFLPLAIFLPLMLKPCDASARWRVPYLALLPLPPLMDAMVVMILEHRYYA